MRARESARERNQLWTTRLFTNRHAHKRTQGEDPKRESEGEQAAAAAFDCQRFAADASRRFTLYGLFT